MKATLLERGMAGRVGFGTRPALLVVDLVRGFTEPSSPLGADMSSALAATRTILDAFAGRAFYSVPVAEEGLWSRKIPSSDLLCPAAS
jgi:hypothetical protein